MNQTPIKKWLLKNPPRLSLILLMIILSFVLIYNEILNYKINAIVVSFFWLLVGVNIGVNWGIEAMKSRTQGDTDYKRSKNMYGDKQNNN